MTHRNDASRLPGPFVTGIAMIEWLVAVPICLVVGLGVLQWALVLNARHSLHLGIEQAARYAAVDFGRGSAINDGLAKGLQPFWLSPVPAVAQANIRLGLSAGWISWQRIAPGSDAFADFSEPARTRSGQSIAGEREIPNDNLRYRTTANGAKSGISIQEANRITLELTYGIPLYVPILGGFIVRVMEIIDGCRGSEQLILATTNLGEPAKIERRQWTCAVYRAPHSVGGSPVWRLPVRIRAQRWMQSPLRSSSSISSKTADRGAPSAPVVTTPPVRSGPDVLEAPPRAAYPPIRPPGSGGGSIRDDLIGPVPNPGQCPAPG